MSQQITREQRYEIYAYKQAGLGKSEIAERLGVHRSTIYREFERNSDKRSGEYRPDLANRKRDKRMKGRNHAIKMDDGMKAKIDRYLESGWSPEQIHGRCKSEGVAMVSYETIYKYVYEDKAKKDNGKKLHEHLRHKGRKYSKRGSQYKTRGMIQNRTDIDLRPDIVDQKLRFGDLEGDTIIGKNHKGAIVTIIDRVSGYLWMKKLSGKEASPLADMTIELLAPFKDVLHTLTVDNGKEFAKHDIIAQKLGIDVFFAHPYHSWERGANENTNGLIRQYFPKGSDFDDWDDLQIQLVMNAINNRPRKRLGFRTPLEVAKSFSPEFF